MAIAEYPTGLPYPSREGYGLQHVSPLQRTEMRSGRARQRRRFTSVPSEVQVSWLMTQEQAQIFEGFFRWGVTDGADWFNCPLQTPLGIQLYEARFTDVYDGPELVGVDYWRFTAQLEIRERQTLTKLWYDFSDYIFQQSIIDKAINREWPNP
jgi:hypothetical protein